MGFTICEIHIPIGLLYHFRYSELRGTVFRVHLSPSVRICSFSFSCSLPQFSFRFLAPALSRFRSLALLFRPVFVSSFGTSAWLLPRFCTFFSSGLPLSVLSFQAFRFVSLARASLVGSFGLSTYQPPCLSSHALISDLAFLLPDFGSFRPRSAMHLTGFLTRPRRFPISGLSTPAFRFLPAFVRRLSLSFRPPPLDLSSGFFLCTHCPPPLPRISARPLPRA